MINSLFSLKSMDFINLKYQTIKLLTNNLQEKKLRDIFGDLRYSINK